MRLYLVPLCILYAFCARSQDLSLAEARALLLKNNGEYQASGFAVNKLAATKKATKGLHYPNLQLSGNYFRLQDDIAVDLNPQKNRLAGLLNVPDPNLLGDWRRVLQDQDFAFASASFNWPLFTGGKINAANKASGLRLAIGQKEQGVKERQLTINLITAYYRLKLAKELLKLRLEVLQLVTLHKDRADKFFENGLIPEVETLNAKVAHANAKREVLATEKDVALAQTALAALVGETGHTTLVTPFHYPEQMPPLAAVSQKLIEASYRLQILEDNKMLAGQGIKAEKSAYFPALAARANYRFFQKDFALGQTEWFLGLGMRWTIFNGFQREHKIKAAKHQQAQVGALKSQATLALATLAEKLYNSLQKQTALHQSLENDQLLAEKLHFMRKRAFEEGMGTSIAVVDATLQLAQLRFQRLKNLYDYSITKGELMVYTGELNNFLMQ